MILVYMFMDKLYAYTLRKQIFESALLIVLNQ